MKLKYVLTGLIACLILVAFASQASASEGQAEMKNLVGDPSQCQVTSGLFAGSEYNILVLCRDLVYRNNPEALYYIVWAQPTQGGDPIKLGDLGLGNALFKTKTSFNRVFATQERDRNVKKPTGVVAMSGNMHGFALFSTNSASPVAPTNPEPLITPSPTPMENTSFLSRFRTGGVITVVSVIVIIIMLVVVKPFK